jgi:hypothetical protein
MNPLSDLLGSPFVDKPPRRFTDPELLGVYDLAFKNRVALLYLSQHRRSGWDPRLEEQYQTLKHREQTTFDVIARLAEVLNAWVPDEYVIFKSIKPYPATPNDTDVICFADAPGYEEMYEYLMQKGYIFHEWAPQQRTVYDPRGAGKIGPGKKGGTYYIDLYAEISTDYFSYMDKQRLRPFIVTRQIGGVPVRLLRPEPELAIVMFHSVFPERTFQLEHFYVPLYMLEKPEFELDVFIRFARESGVAYAVKTQCALIASIHFDQFGFVPKPIQGVLDALGTNAREVNHFKVLAGRTPYMFTPRTFWTAFAIKAAEWHCFKSLLWQGVQMLNPKFSLEVLKSIRLRMSARGAYNLE